MTSKPKTEGGLAPKLELTTSARGASLSERVFQSLSDGLRSGVIKPGDRLREDEIALAFGVSRTPVREALGRLVANRVLETSGNRGVKVRRLDIAEVLELYGMREILEGAAAALAAHHATEPEIAALRDLERAFESELNSPAKMAHINRIFHESIFRAARNRYLEDALKELQDAIALLGPTTFNLGARPNSATSEHQHIVTAIAKRDSAAAEQHARRHIREALRARLQLMQS